MAQTVGRGIALLFHDRGTRNGWVVSSTPRPYFTPGKDPVPIVQEAGWAPGSVWTGGKFRPTGIRSPDHPARSQSLYRLNYPAHKTKSTITPKYTHKVEWINSKIIRKARTLYALDYWRTCTVLHVHMKALFDKSVGTLSVHKEWEPLNGFYFLISDDGEILFAFVHCPTASVV